MGERSQPQGWGEIKPGLGFDLALMLHGRDGTRSHVALADGMSIQVRAASWGRDFGDVWEHLFLTDTKGLVHFVMSSDVAGVVDPFTGAELYRKKP